jgi:hypothetical protein
MPSFELLWEVYRPKQSWNSLSVSIYKRLKLKIHIFFSENSDIKTFLSISYPLIILKTWHKPSTLIAKAMCQFISVVNIAIH